MFSGLHDIDWASMHHAYGTAEEIPALLTALRSPDAAERDKALDRFYGAVHHQGDVYPCTAASLPFLAELAADPAAPGRADLVELLVSIGREALDRGGDDDGIEWASPVGHAQALAALRERAELIVSLAADPDPGVRRAAIPGLALFLDDPRRAAALLRDRLAAESGIQARLAAVAAMTTLAHRLPAAADAAMEWLTGLAADPAVDPPTRLAALVHRARCAPDRIAPETVPTAVGLLRQLARPVPATPAAATPATAPVPATAPAGGVPPQVLAAFDDLDRHNRVHAPTTRLLRTFHTVLAGRVPERTALLTEQLRTPDPGARMDAVRMGGELMRAWRGDHTPLVSLLAAQLTPDEHEVSAEAAEVLESCHPIIEPAREALAAQVTAHVATHGPDVWAAPDPRLRRAHQQAVRALARLGDARAVPSLLTALDGGTDAWRAVDVAARLPQAADRLVPRLCAHLRGIDPAREYVEMSAGPLVSALAALGDPAALPLLADTLAAAVKHEQARLVAAVLKALAAFGIAAAPALPAIRPLTASTETHVRPAAVAALWAAGGDPEEVMPLLLDLLDDSVTFRISDAADVLGEMGPRAEAALPRLRGQLTHGYEWVGVHCAAALWEIGGPPEAPAVLDTLLPAWAANGATANHVVACLDRMGALAAPALPQLRAELALDRRGGRFSSIAHDEELQRIGHALMARLVRLSPPAPEAPAPRTA